MKKAKIYKTELAKIQPWNQGAPQINAPEIFGARPKHAFYMPLPTTGQRPLLFSAENLPGGLSLDKERGIITGNMRTSGRFNVEITAQNRLGRSRKRIRILIGEQIALTPPLGWNSWNCWGKQVDQGKIQDSAVFMVKSGLAAHGYSYINIDDGWQGQRSGVLNALQPNEKFPDLKGLCDFVHTQGLRIGIYSTPWAKSYCKFNGGSAGNPVKYMGGYDNEYSRQSLVEQGRYFGEKSFHNEDAQQWSEWGIDYLKYDWRPWEEQEVQDMSTALSKCGRDIVYSLSNSAPFQKAAIWSKLANCWRTTGDITDTWSSVSDIAFHQDKWIPYAGNGHWNDPDMLVIGNLGWGKVRKNRLTKNEQIMHITMWALLAAPLLIGCDLSKLDKFTLSLLCNDEVLAINQDPLGIQGHCVREIRQTNAKGKNILFSDIYAKRIQNNKTAIGVFNRSDTPQLIEIFWADIGLKGKRTVRNVWANKDIGVFDKKFQIGVPPHGAQLLLI